MAPRKLPWLEKGSAGKAKGKGSPEPAQQDARKDIDPDDDDFFKDTVLASSGKGKGRAEPPVSDDDLWDLPTASSRSNKSKVRQQTDLPLSSSPPAIEESPQPQAEEMQKAVSRFNLRDDEWMMVEDEFLQTAKLFTRHLHLAQYEHLKEDIQKKKEEIARAVIQNPNPSDELKMQMRIEAQTKKQRKTLREALSQSGTNDIEDYLGSSPPEEPTSSRPKSSRPTRQDVSSTASKRVARKAAASDSEDLDAQKPASKPLPADRSQSRSHITTAACTKPQPPSNQNQTTARPARSRGFLLLDELPPKRPPSPTRNTNASVARPSSSTKVSQTSAGRSISPGKSFRAPIQQSRPLGLLDEPKASSLVSKSAQAERLAKRKPEQEKGKEKAKRKNVDVDDIPTFLF